MCEAASCLVEQQCFASIQNHHILSPFSKTVIYCEGKFRFNVS